MRPWVLFPVLHKKQKKERIRRKEGMKGGREEER
jgi:hypothetical protein